jgi:hypothetical protein
MLVDILVGKVRKLWVKVSRMILKLIKDQLQDNQETIRQILPKDLEERKICGKFVLHSLMHEQKDQRVNIFNGFFAGW